MTNYQNGKVYKISCINGEEGDIYVGSTAKQYLSQRMTKHRESYKLWKERKADYVSAYDLFDRYGVKNCSIMLLETYPCNSRDELRGREGFHMRSLACVNKNMAGRTQGEWCEDNKEIIKQKRHQKYEKNKEMILRVAELVCQSIRKPRNIRTMKILSFKLNNIYNIFIHIIHN
jgi:hypothetical protein